MAWSSYSGLLFAEIRCTAALFPVFQPAAALFCFNPRDPLRLLGLSFLASPSPAPRGRPQTPYSLRTVVLQRFSRFLAGRGR